MLLYEPAFRRLESRLAEFDGKVAPIIVNSEGQLPANTDQADIEIVWASPDLFIDGALKSFMVHVRDAHGLRWFQCGSAGYDNPLLRQVIDRGASFSINPAPAVSVAEYVMTSVLGQFQGTAKRRESAAAHMWAPAGFREVAESRWLIVGFGAIGRRVARLAKAFDARVVGVNRHGGSDEWADEMCTPATLTRALPDADVVVIALPLNASTRGLVNGPFLGRMKPSSVLVNVARGAILDEAALLEALDRGTPAHALLDVFAAEPLPRTSPLWTHPQVSITAHVAGMGGGLLARSDRFFLENLRRYLAGEDVVGRVAPPEK
jgi:phosphoglycerate dehydrogenase-like enzyme